MWTRVSKGRKTIEQKLAGATDTIHRLKTKLWCEKSWCKEAYEQRNRAHNLERALQLSGRIVTALLLQVTEKDKPFVITEQELYRIAKERKAIIETNGDVYKLYIEE